MGSCNNKNKTMGGVSLRIYENNYEVACTFPKCCSSLNAKGVTLITKH